MIHPFNQCNSCLCNALCFLEEHCFTANNAACFQDTRCLTSAAHLSLESIAVQGVPSQVH